MNLHAGDIINNWYILRQKLGEGGMGIVFRATDRLHGEDIALKKVILNNMSDAGLNPTISTDMKLLLAQEFSILATLRHPNIISVLDYGFAPDNSPFFTMRLLEDAKEARYINGSNNTPNTIRLAIQLFQALSYLHRREILHRDLKSANVLITKNRYLYVLDFGLAIERQETEEIVGTIAYIAPEILNGSSPDERSDLYAAGLVFYEMLLGKHPYGDKSIRELINAVLLEEPDYTDLLPLSQAFQTADDSQTTLIQILEGLLAKDPNDRYASAEEVIIDLSDLLGLTSSQEPTETVDSYLKGAQFIGREQELQSLINAVAKLPEQHSGQMMLIGGESGVGKSRLLEEVRVHALVEGVLVLRGQAVQGRTSMFQMWHDPLRHLILQSDLSELEASVLQTIIPDIERLFGQPVETPPILDQGAFQKRLLNIIMDIFRRQTRPTLLILEDLHWSDESILLLQQLSEYLDEIPLLVVATYRNDERPNLPHKLPNANVVKLERFTSDYVAKLSVAMLGKDATTPKLLEYLEQQTEGNVFFLIEILRSLADSAGGLKQIQEMSLPETILPGGINAILQRRLSRLPDWAYDGLCVAAVAGRVLDLNILKMIITPTLSFASADAFATTLPSVWQRKNGITFDDWLLLCSDAAVLTVRDDRWFFAHDKLREHILAELSLDYFIVLHRQVGRTIERIYKDQLPQWAATLVEHWQMGNMPEKARYYATLAGQQALNAGIAQEAKHFFELALEISDIDAEVSDLQIKVYLADVARLMGQHDLAVDEYQKILTVPYVPVMSQAQCYIGLAWVMENKGQDQASFDYAEKAEVILRSLTPIPFTTLSDALYHKGWALFRLGNGAAAYQVAQEGIGISRGANAKQQHAHHLNLMSIVECYIFEDYGLAHTHQLQALELHRSIGDRQGEGVMLNNLGETAFLIGNYEQAKRLYHQAHVIAERIGDQDGALVYASNLGGSLTMLGESELALRTLTDVLVIAPSDWYALPDSYRFIAEAHLQLENFANAHQFIGMAFEIPALSGETFGHLWRVAACITAFSDGEYHFTDENGTMSADACFKLSLQIFDQNGLTRGRAKVLLDWAESFYRIGNEKLAKRLVDEAIEIFSTLNLQLFLDGIRQKWDKR